ncbi:two-component system sensor histidine kinase BprS [Massilia terrae]|uniref:histidine kinase n=1 Tax=Massilia terrae TaxID=1811224 RepID=A0ABT2D122_9BURK|nr:ATP-binding protein [Massilia terrae]MCS0659120.1 ATP-binding protein [Massilia terrae]
MNRIFFRFFVLVMLSITAATFVIYLAISQLFGDPVEDIARRQAAAPIVLLQDYVDRAGPDEWLTRLNKARETSPVRYDLIDLDEARQAVPVGTLAELERGDVVIVPATRTLYRRVDLNGERYIGSEHDVLRATNLPIDLAVALQKEIVRFVIVALALLVPIALWSRSHWQGLQVLSRVADEFGAGQLDARAHMQPSASIYPLAERINHMADRIANLLQSQKNLLHSVSHELRTPIARLEFGLELLSAKAADPALEKRIKAMEGDVAELNDLVNELLGMARLDSAQSLQLAPFTLGPMLRDCVQALPPSPHTLGCALGDELGSVEADRRLLGRAISNLLRNAQKYAGQRIVLSAARTEAGRVEIAIEDDGPGIPAEDRARIFEPFYRLDRSRDRATGGFGLGLSIAQKAVVLHGGTLQIDESPTLGGARFIIALPPERVL